MKDMAADFPGDEVDDWANPVFVFSVGIDTPI